MFIGSKMRELRKSLGFTQKKIAEILEISPQQFQQYETGETTISAQRLFNISQIFNVGINYFYDGLKVDIAKKNAIAEDGIICGERYRPLKILLVEDNYKDQILISEAIDSSDEDVVVTSINDGDEAINFLKMSSNKYHDSKRPDIILLDMNLPKKSGKDILKFVKQNENLRDIQVIMLTNSVDPEDMMKSYKLFSSSYIKKSQDFDKLSELMQKLISYWYLVITPSMQYE